MGPSARSAVLWLTGVATAFVILPGLGAIDIADQLVSTNLPFRAAPSELFASAVVGVALSMLCFAPLAVVLFAAWRRQTPTSLAVIAAILLGAVLLQLEGRVFAVVRGVLRSTAELELAAVIIGPFMEELAKLAAVALVLVCGKPRPIDLRRGLLLGAAAGIGATIIEVALYAELSLAQGGTPAYETIIASRLGLLGVNIHVVTAALAGAGLGAWLAGGRVSLRPLVTGVIGAVAVHALWNLYGPDVGRWFIDRIATLNPRLIVQYLPMVVFAASAIAHGVVLVIPLAGLAIAWRRGANAGS